MHGLDWMRAALAEVDRVVQQGGLSEINCLRIAVGEFSGYPVEELAFAFECLRDNTACHNARLEVRVVAAGKGIDLLEVEGV